MSIPSGLSRLPKTSEERGALLLSLIAPVLGDLQRSEETLARNLASQYECINTLCKHIERFKGKRLRPAVLLLSARAFGRGQEAETQNSKLKTQNSSYTLTPG